MSVINFDDLLGAAQAATSEKDFLEIFRSVAAQENATAKKIDSIIEIGVEKIFNDLHNSKSLKRLNLLFLACVQAKNKRLAKALLSLPEYLGLGNCLAHDKKTAVFYVSQSAAFDAACGQLVMPTTKFFAWLADQKPTRKEPQYTEARAIADIRRLHNALRGVPALAQSAKFVELFAALENHMRQNDPAFMAQLEIDAMLRG